MNDIEAKSRGHQAEALLRDEMLIDAMKQVRYAAHRAFEAANGDPVKLQRASDLLTAAADFQMYLKMAVDQGAAAAKRIDRDLQGGGFVRGIGRMARNREPFVEGTPWRDAV